MGRYRAPPPPSSPYITPEGASRLREELDHLWRRKRPKVTAALAEAAAEGDRSENAEYIYRKKQLGEIDRRIRYLRKRLEVLKVVDGRPDDSGRIFFGAWIRLEDEDGEERTYRIVGADELDPAKNHISLDSPMARALLGRSVGDELFVDLPGGKVGFCVLDVTYSSFPDR
jgi:transcription elongation factor GreB